MGNDKRVTDAGAPAQETAAAIAESMWRDAPGVRTVREYIRQRDAALKAERKGVQGGSRA